MELVAIAASVARVAHVGQVDKSGRGYIAHPERVALRVVAEGGSDVAVAAAWLHDVLEDTAVTADDLRGFGLPEEVIAAVEAVTKRDGEAPMAYASRVAANEVAVLVKRADLADNQSPPRLRLLKPAVRDRLSKKYSEFEVMLAAAIQARQL